MKKTIVLNPCDSVKLRFGTQERPSNLALSMHTIQPCKVTIEVEFFDYDLSADDDDDLPF